MPDSLSALTADQLAGRRIKALWALDKTRMAKSGYAPRKATLAEWVVELVDECERRASGPEGHWAAMAVRERERREEAESERDQAVRERDADVAAAEAQWRLIAASERERADRLAAALAEVNSWLVDWVKAGQHTQEWEFYIGKLFDALAASRETPDD